MPLHHPHGPDHSHHSPSHREAKITRRGLLAAGAGGLILGGTAMGVRKLLKGHDHSAQVLERWRQEQHIFDSIEQAGGIQQYVNSLPQEEIRQTFFMDKNAPQKKCRCCVDEGIRSIRDNTTGQSLRLSKEAGSGVLNLGVPGFDPRNYNPMDEGYIRAVATRHNQEGVEEESSHDECGAARAAYGIMHRLTPEQLEQVSDEVINQFARDWTDRMFKTRQDLLTREGQVRVADTLSLRHVRFDQMDRPSHLHIPRTIYYGREQDYSYQKLPQGYGVDRELLPSGIAQQNMVISKKINFGAHGPGGLFTRDNPQLIVCVGEEGNPELALSQLQRECQQVLANDPDFQAGKVVITGFTPGAKAE